MSNLPALILAAGRGERMRPLTDHTPKPLLHVRGKPLIEWHLLALARDGVKEVVINTAWLEEMIPAALGDGSRWGLRIRYSMEGRDHGGALETAGGMAKALPWLGDAFWSLSGDIHAPDFVFSLEAAERFRQGDDWGHLWLVDNPPHVPHGDFALSPEGRVTSRDEAPPGWPRRTYSNFALYRPALVDHITPGTKAALLPSLQRAMAQHKLSGQRYDGRWMDVGTPQRLAQVNEQDMGDHP